MDWGHSSLSSFFRGPVMGTPEGWIVLTGGTLSLAFAFLGWLVPGWIGISTARIPVAVTLFAVWPICLFTIYVRVCSPDFRPRVFTIVFVLCAAVIPFWLAYR